MHKARLIVTYDCPRSCAGCCNKDWKYDPPTPIKSVAELQDFHEIIITGGEPTLFDDNIEDLVSELVDDCAGARFVIYSASPNGVSYLDSQFWDGITLTLHDDKAVEEFEERVNDGSLDFSDSIKYGHCFVDLRLHVFKGVRAPQWTGGWKIKKDIEWIKDCPLPHGEHLFKLEETWTTKKEQSQKQLTTVK